MQTTHHSMLPYKARTFRIPSKFSTRNYLQSLGTVSAASHLEELDFVVRAMKTVADLSRVEMQCLVWGFVIAILSLKSRHWQFNLTQQRNGFKAKLEGSELFMPESWSQLICEWLDVPCANLQVFWGPLKGGHSSHMLRKTKKAIPELKPICTTVYRITLA